MEDVCERHIIRNLNHRISEGYESLWTKMNNLGGLWASEIAVIGLTERLGYEDVR